MFVLVMLVFGLLSVLGFGFGLVGWFQSLSASKQTAILTSRLDAMEIPTSSAPAPFGPAADQQWPQLAPTVEMVTVAGQRIPADVAVIATRLAHDGRLIEAIKLVREQTGLGLKESKAVVDQL